LPAQTIDPDPIPAPARWSPAARIAFRFFFCYCMQYALFCDHRTLFCRIPRIGATVQDKAALLYLLPARWLGQHLFHLTGAAAVIHPSAFADRALDWIAAGLMLAVALVATLIWSLLDETRSTARKRLAYPMLFGWLRWTLRLTIIISLVWYASIKVFPIQIESPSLAVLNERVGDTSPMTMLWTVLGMNHTYELVCGLVEFTAVVLLFYRRTALAGAMLALVIMANIVLFDVFFDVPVRLYAGNLLLMTLVLIAPDVPALWRFFWERRPAMPNATWNLSASPRWLRLAAMTLEIVLALTSVKLFTYSYHQTRGELAGERHPAAISGQWHIDTSIGTSSEMAPGQTQVLLSGSGSPQTDLFLEPSGRVNLRSADRRLWGGGRYSPDRHEIILVSAMRDTLLYNFSQPDADHLILTPAPSFTRYPTLTLTRVPLPQSYPLYERKPHLVEEWGFER
jgi:hypothetical protein